MREETAKRGEVRKSPSGARRQPCDQDDSHADENNDRGNFYPGEPVFELSEVAYVQRIDANNPEGYDGNPDPLRNGREPELEINGNRRHLCTDSDDLHEAVRRTNGEASPGIQIALCVDAERSGNRMDHSHLRQRVGHDERQERSEDIGQNDGGSGEAYGDAAAEEKAHPNGAADGDHG